MGRASSTAILLAVIAFAIVNAGNALHKGGDFVVFVESGRRVLASEPLYTGSGPGDGVIGPPFQAVFFAPAAWLSERHPDVARLTWYLLNLAALFAGIGAWATALSGDGRPSKIWQVPAVWLAAAAVLLPAQTNFEHQNMNALLLAFLGFGALAIRRDHPLSGGAWLGLATALKAFPGLVLLYLAARRQWRAFAAGVVVAGVLTLSLVPFAGIAPTLDTLDAWLAINRDGGWPVRGQNQSLYAAFQGLLPAVSPSVALGIAAGLGGAVLAFGALLRRRTIDARELGMATLVSVITAPIAWDHYWLLAYPSLFSVLTSGARLARATFWGAATLITGTSPATMGAGVYHAMRAASVSTLAGILLIVMAALDIASRKQPSDRFKAGQ